MGAALLLAGIVTAIVTSPVFDRILTHHLGITVRIFCPIIGAAWLSLIWVGKDALSPFTAWTVHLAPPAFIVKPHNTGVLFTLFGIIGVGSITLLPVAVELGVELTRNPDGSSAILWLLCAPSFAPTNAALKPIFIPDFVFCSGNLLCIIFVLCQHSLLHS